MMICGAAWPCLVAGACGRSDRNVAGDTVRIPPAQVAAPVAAAGKADTSNPCAHTGRWTLCTLERRMRQAGFVARRLDEDASARAGFSVKPVAYSLGRARLEVFLYDDQAAMARDMAALDTALVSPRGSAGTQWESTPTLIRSGNLAAVFLATSPVQAERLVLAITAGAPQPGSPR